MKTTATVVDGVELIGGLLLLSNRYVPLALTMLAAVIFNIIVFHVTMAPMGLPLAAIVVALWAVVAYQYRSSFAPLLAQKPAASDRAAHWAHDIQTTTLTHA
jgi:putative oxidoreductase